ncbi:LacI family DNA-binding transcriptional regulator [Streptosporangium fragile]|uniref:LacI family DNA-binding transcriptional regulator n=1 Tax=Streptosporangium fragile TaxID=46186 RepID=A0ABN3WDR3_9ACTN
MTIIDVARHAGVSKTTASDALSGGGRVSPETRERIAAAAALLGYVPNAAARHLRRSRVGAVGLHVPRQAMGMGFYMEFAFGVAERAREAGLDLTLLALDPAQAGRPRLRVDGVIIIDPLPDDPVTGALLSADVPVVTVGRHRGPGPAPAGVLVADHAAMMNRLLGHLHAAGASAPGLVVPDDGFRSDWALLVRETYERWCRDHGATPVVRSVAVDATPDTVDEVIRDLVTGGPGLDAVICAPDGSALRALSTLKALGRPVGDRLLLASCVASPSMELCDPPITAIDLRPRRYGNSAAGLLTGILAGTVEPEERGRPVERLHPVELLVRPSTAFRAETAPPRAR